MDYRENVRRAVEYIEARLTGKADLEEAAAEACYSLYHFSRVFALAVGESPGSYLRRRRLASAATRLRTGGERVIDLALEFGFGSQEAFSRAFKEEFGVAPGAYRRGAGAREGRRSALSEGFLLPGGIMAKFRMEKLPAKLVAGFPCYGKGGPDGIFNEVWDLFNERLVDHGWHAGKPGIGVEFYAGDCSDMEKWFYLAGSFADSIESLPPNLAVKPIPASDYAVFEHRGFLATLGETYKAAYGEALPEAGLEPWLPIDFELYDGRFTGPKDEGSVIEVWIPVRKKGK